MIRSSLPSLCFCLTINLNHSLNFIPTESFLYAQGTAPVCPCTADSLWCCCESPTVWHTQAGSVWGWMRQHHTPVLCGMIASLALLSSCNLLSLYCLLETSWAFFSVIISFQVCSVFFLTVFLVSVSFISLLLFITSFLVTTFFSFSSSLVEPSWLGRYRYIFIY